MQIYRKFEAKMRIDFVSEIEKDQDEFDEEEGNKVVTSSYFVKYLSDAIN